MRIASFSIKRPADLPLEGMVTRESKGRYIVDIYFKQSSRYYGNEIICASHQREAKKWAERLYPTLKWRK